MAASLCKEQIAELMPGRSGMFALDEIRELVPGVSATAHFLIEPAHCGRYSHFAGVHTVQLAIEVSSVIALTKPEYHGKKDVLLGINHVRLFKMLFPGDFVEIHTSVLSERKDKRIVTTASEVYRRGEKAAEIELALAIR